MPTNSHRDVDPVNLTVDPFVSSSTKDFRLNSDAGGGAECRQIEITKLAGAKPVYDIGAIDAVLTSSGGGGSIFHPLAQ